jgi:hypothetical protein
VNIVAEKNKAERKKKEKKKEPIFRMQENGLIMTAENMIAVGLPTEVETMDMGKGAIVLPFGGKGEGKKYKKVKYVWRIISSSPLPPKEIEKLIEPIATGSNTIVTSLDNATILPVQCKKCGKLNYYGKFCSNCGNPL